MTPDPRLTRRAWVGALVLGLEYLALSTWLDLGETAKRGGVWTLISHVGLVAPLGALVVTAVALLRRRQAIGFFPRTSWRACAVHVLALAGFFAITSRLFAPEHVVSPWWVLPWLMLAGLVPISLMAALFGVERAAAQRRRRLAAGALGLGTLAWIMAIESQSLWHYLATPTLLVSARLLGLFSDAVAVDRSEQVLGFERFAVEIAPECSGCEGIGLGLVLVGGFLISLRQELRFPRAFWLLPVIAGLMWMANAVRIALLVLIGARWSESLALGAFHSKAGWLSFCLITLAVGWWARGSLALAAAARPQEEHWEHPAAPLLVPLLAVLTVSLLTGAFAQDWDWYYGLRIVAAAAALAFFRHSYAGASWSWHKTGIPAMLGLAVAIPWILLSGAKVPFAERVAPHFAAYPGWLLPTWVGLRVLGSVLVAPVVEELAFRGYLLRRLVARDFDRVPFVRWTPWAVLGSSAAFGLLHDRWWLATLAGIVYAYAVVRRGHLMDGIVAHASTNAVVAGYVLLSGDWSCWS